MQTTIPEMQQAVNEKQQARDDAHNAISRLLAIPLLAETISRIVNLIEKNSYLAALFHQAESVANSVYSMSKPGLERLPLSTANIYANKSLDYVQEKFPAVFETHTDEIVKSARKPADAAVEIFQTRLGAAQQSLTVAQDRLAGVVAGVPKTSDEAQKAVSSLIAELNKLKESATVNVKELPHNVQQIVNPLTDHLNTGIHDITAELGRKDVPIATRASNVLNYSRENATPIIQEALENLKGLVVKKKDELKEQQPNGTSETIDEVHSYAEAAKKNAVGPH